MFLFSGQGKRLSSETPDTLRINRIKERNTTTETLIIIKQTIQEPFNPRKRVK